MNKEADTYNVSVTLIDHDGNPSGFSSALLLGLDSFAWIDLYDEDGTATVRVPKGRYNLSAGLFTHRGEDVEPAASLQVRPVVEVNRDVSVTFDARDGKAVVTTVPERTAVPALVKIEFIQVSAGGGYGTGLRANSFEELSVLQVGPPVEGFTSSVTSYWVEEDADGNIVNTPYLYAVAEGFVGRLPDGYVKHVRREDLAAVKTEFGPAPEGMIGERVIFPVLEPNIYGPIIVVPVGMPSRRTEYLYAPGVRWVQELSVSQPAPDPWSFPEVFERFVQPPRKYQPGQLYQDAWRTGPFGPVLPAPQWPEQWATRRGDTLIVDLPLYGDRGGHAGYSRTDTSRTALYRDDELVGEFPDSAFGRFRVPPERAEYRLEVADTRSVGDLSTEVRGVWTFQSAHVPGSDFAKLPLCGSRRAWTPTTRLRPAGRSRSRSPCNGSPAHRTAWSPR